MVKKLSDVRVVATSSLVSIGDVVLNVIVGILTGSTVMFAQALQGLSDLVTSGLLLYGVASSKKSSNRSFQFGYGREIFFWVLLAGLIMFLGTGIISLIMGWRQFIDPGTVESVYIALALLLFNIATNGYALSLSIKRLRQSHPKAKWRWRLRHSSVVETKATLFVDFLGTAAGVIGLIALSLFALTNDARFDGIGSMAIGLSMMFASGYLIRDVREFIIGRAADPALESRIIEVVRSVQGVHDVLDLRTMYLGSGRLLIIIEVHLHNGLDTDTIEQTVDHIKLMVDKNVPGSHHVQVEVETPDHELS